MGESTSHLSAVVPAPSTWTSADTAARVEGGGGWRHHHGCRIVGAVIWLAVVVYVLWLATRMVRAVERLADRSQGRAPST
jgi:threonine/homoserine/homoserine lactone efflux protein